MCPSGQLLENQYQTVHQVKQVKNNAASNEKKKTTFPHSKKKKCSPSSKVNIKPQKRS